MRGSEVITFDCYGTLIDWEAGIGSSLKKAMATSGAKTDLQCEAVSIYEAEEARIESQRPHRLYREVMSETVMAVARRIGWSLPNADSSFLAESLPQWMPFPDTNPALKRLARDHTLGILSNVDNDLLTATLKRLDARFDILVTAENVGSYKPNPGHFREARRLIGERPWLHVAGSYYHDIKPAVAMGIRAVWVNRKGSSAPPGSHEKNVVEVKNLTGLADWFESQ